MEPEVKTRAGSWPVLLVVASGTLLGCVSPVSRVDQASRMGGPRTVHHDHWDPARRTPDLTRAPSTRAVPAQAQEQRVPSQAACRRASARRRPRRPKRLATMTVELSAMGPDRACDRDECGLSGLGTACVTASCLTSTCVTTNAGLGTPCSSDSSYPVTAMAAAWQRTMACLVLRDRSARVAAACRNRMAARASAAARPVPIKARPRAARTERATAPASVRPTPPVRRARPSRSALAGRASARSSARARLRCTFWIRSPVS